MSPHRWLIPTTSALLLFLIATVASAAQTPYSGSPIQLPGTFEAENYDRGSEGEAYHDTTPGNVFGRYRTDSMDVGLIPSASGGGYHIGYLADGEWAEYTVDVPRSQAYEVRLWVASNSSGTKNFHLELDGVNVSGTQTIAFTGNWHNYVVKTLPAVFLTAGNHRVLRIAFDRGAWNLDRVEIRGQVPWSGAAAAIPGRIQGENYDRGGEGLAYHDTTAGNVFGTYRTDDMDVGRISTGGYHVGFVASGEWAEYTVNVQQTRAYELLMRVASADARTVRYHVELDGQNLTGSRTVPHTGGWSSYITQVIPVGTLSAGNNKILRVSFDLNAFNLDWLELRAAACAAPAITLHPQSRTVEDDVPVTLTVAATGSAPLSYQWFHNGGPLAGATGSSLALSTVQHHETGEYFVRVSNSCGSVDSNRATLLLVCGPGELEQTLSNVLQGRNIVCPWTTKYSSGFPNAMGGGSFNTPVLAAAIAAVVDPNRAGPDPQNPGVRGWWRKYLRGELGQRGTEWAFGGKEPFSHVYQHYNIGAVMAVHYESRRRGWTDVRDLARNWLRATFALMAAAAVDEPASFHDRGRVTPVVNNYSGPWVATAGMRTWHGSWHWMSRPILFARAVGLPTNARGEAAYQRSLREFLEGRDNQWNHASEGDVYGLTTSEKTALAGIKGSHSLPAGFHGWISGVRTAVPYHIVGWSGVRVTLMEASRNNNTAPTYGIASFNGAREAHMLYPWSTVGRRYRNCIRHGSAAIDPALTWIEATNGPEPASGLCVGRHPEEKVRISNLPGGTPRYHLMLPPYRSNW